MKTNGKKLLRVDEYPGHSGQGPEPSEDEIRRRAHEICRARGEAPGDELQDWLQAERELGDRSGGA